MRTNAAFLFVGIQRQFNLTSKEKNFERPSKYKI